MSKEKDLELFHQWKNTGDKQALGDLMSNLHPLIYSEVQRAAGTLPSSALSAEAKKWTLKALQSYDPSKNVAVSTHVMNYLPKVRRMNYKFQNSARLPENMQLQFHQWHKANSYLQEKHDREPTESELADHLGWSKKSVVRYKNSLYSDLIESASERPQEVTQFNKQKVLYDYIQTQLSREEKIIFDNIDKLSSQQLADKLGVNVNRLNYMKRLMTEKIKSLQDEVKWS